MKLMLVFVFMFSSLGSFAKGISDDEYEKLKKTRMVNTKTRTVQQIAKKRGRPLWMVP